MRWLHQRLGSCLSVLAAVLVAVAVVQSIPSAAADDLPSSSRVSGAGKTRVPPAHTNKAAKPAEDPKAPCDPGAGEDDPKDGKKQPKIPARPKDEVVAAVMKVQDRHTMQLLAIEGVVGVATGLSKNGEVVVMVFTEHSRVGEIPARLEGVRVEAQKTGRFCALQRAVPRPRPRSTIPNTQDFHRRPVPIGVSISPALPGFTFGTLGCRVKDRQGNVYMLSNNHVLADNSALPIGTVIIQPGWLDLRSGATGIRYGDAQTIGYLEKFVKIFKNPAPVNVTAATRPNKVDAAIASCTTATVGNTTPKDGYGWYSSTPVKAYLGQPVQKYGARTGYSQGRVDPAVVWGLNGSFGMILDQGTGEWAYFVNQILIMSPAGPAGAFSLSGDSGSLIVSASWPSARRARPEARHPVGLLFSGPPDQSPFQYTWANPIEEVLKALDVKIDGK